jgi:hypothetical protein
MSKSALSSGLVATIFDFQDSIADHLIHAFRQPFNEVPTIEHNRLYTPSGEQAYQAFVLVKIWTTLCARTSRLRTDDGKVVGAPRVHRRLAMSLSSGVRRFWNAIWPSMKTQLTGFIVERNVQV